MNKKKLFLGIIKYIVGLMVMINKIFLAMTPYAIITFIISIYGNLTPTIQIIGLCALLGGMEQQFRLTDYLNERREIE